MSDLTPAVRLRSCPNVRPDPGCAQVGIALGLCALQIALSHWWLARFQYGPVEWVWRALTYLSWPPMRGKA